MGGGNCFEAALGLLSRLPDSVDLRLIHAVITSEVLPGLRHVHAWIEKDGKVIDKSKGAKREAKGGIVMSKEDYYRLHDVRQEPDQYHSYTQKEAANMVVRFNHCGPWERLEDYEREGEKFGLNI